MCYVATSNILISKAAGGYDGRPWILYEFKIYRNFLSGMAKVCNGKETIAGQIQIKR
jgi:hypothetical protein